MAEGKNSLRVKKFRKEKEKNKFMSVSSRAINSYESVFSAPNQFFQRVVNG